jgi:hypothetical protein
MDGSGIQRGTMILAVPFQADDAGSQGTSLSCSRPVARVGAVGSVPIRHGGLRYCFTEPAASPDVMRVWSGRNSNSVGSVVRADPAMTCPHSTTFSPK